MNTIPYEILIRGHAGKLSGCHVIQTPGADARPITPADLSDLAPAINAAAIATREELEARNAEALAAKDAALAAKDAAFAAQAENHSAALAQAASDLAAANEAAVTAQAAAVEAAKLAIQVNLDGIVAEAEPHFAAVMAAYPDDANVIGLGMVLAKAKGHTTAARRAKLEAEIAAAAQAKADAEAKLAALA